MPLRACAGGEDATARALAIRRGACEQGRCLIITGSVRSCLIITGSVCSLGSPGCSGGSTGLQGMFYRTQQSLWGFLNFTQTFFFPFLPYFFFFFPPPFFSVKQNFQSEPPKTAHPFKTELCYSAKINTGELLRAWSRARLLPKENRKCGIRFFGQVRASEVGKWICRGASARARGRQAPPPPQVFALQAAARTPSPISWLIAFSPQNLGSYVCFLFFFFKICFFHSSSFQPRSHQLQAVGRGARAGVGCCQPRCAVPAAMSCGEGAGLTAALGWGVDSQFMFWLSEETGLLWQPAPPQTDFFLPDVPPRGIQIPPTPSFSLPSNSGAGRMGVLLSVSRLDLGSEYKPLGRVWGDKGASAIRAVPAESGDGTTHVRDRGGSLLGNPPAWQWGASRQTGEGERGGRD